MSAILQIPLNDRDELAMNSLLATGQWGADLAEVGHRLFSQRLFQLCGDALNIRPKIGSEIAEKAANQVTRPAGRGQTSEVRGQRSEVSRKGRCRNDKRTLSNPGRKH